MNQSFLVARPRNTPTSVGKTDTIQTMTEAQMKHPHERGEDFLEILRSPTRLRNTPTSVGKTYNSSSDSGRIEKHPHERGEDLLFLLFAGGC